MKCVEALKRDNCSVFVIIAKRVFAELHKKMTKKPNDMYRIWIPSLVIL